MTDLKPTKMKTIANYAQNVLNENYKNSGSILTIEEWCLIESQNDPDFYRWLFMDVDISDFGSNLTKKDLNRAKIFFQLI